MLQNLRGRLLLLLFALALSVNLGRMAVEETYRSPGPLAVSRAVVIPAAGTAAAAQTLKADGVISLALVFRAAVWFTRTKKPVRAGEFEIPARASIEQILQILRFGPPVQHQVTIPEGLTGSQIARIINAAPAATGNIRPPPEGSILPQTYDYILGTERLKILARAESSLQSALAEAWGQRAPAVPLATPGQAVILASIVQEETPLPRELAEIAAVYENRLKLRMWLQADPTVIYAASDGATASGLPITRADLANPSPYNTYAHPGLPPGPICAPGLAALNAVLHPALSKNLFFVATGAGGHVFAESYAQQRANIAALQLRTGQPEPQVTDQAGPSSLKGRSDPAHKRMDYPEQGGREQRRRLHQHAQPCRTVPGRPSCGQASPAGQHAGY